jgi:hypothetical protein
MRERGTREIEERKRISFVWFSRETGAREEKWWNPWHIFNLRNTAKKRRRSDQLLYSSNTALLIYLHIINLNIALSSYVMKEF